MKNLKNERLLVIAPHPDDEVIGCGGLISRIKEEGGKIFVLFLTVGGTLDYTKGKRRPTKGGERIREIDTVAKFLKFDGWHLAFPDDQYHLRLDSLPQREIIEAIENAEVSLNKTKPTIIAFPSPHSYNQDHRVAAAACFAATRPMPQESKPLQKIVLAYEEPTDSWSQNPQEPLNFYVTLTPGQLETKINALKLYKTQVRYGHHPRSPSVIENLARLRGSQSGQSLAEAFFCYRNLF